MSQKFAASNFVISNFRLVISKIRYFEFCYLEFSRKIMNFSLQTLRKIVRKFDDFSWKIRKNKRRISTNFVCITFAILRCLFWHASDTQHATLNKRFGHLLCYSLNMRIWRVVCHAQRAVSCTRARVITFLLVFPWMVTFSQFIVK